MTNKEAINVLKTRSCYECSWGCDSPVSCHCGGCDLAEATRIAIESLEAPRWIPVTERLPEEDCPVLVYIFGDSPYIAWINRDGEWQTEEFIIDCDYLPKAWMPLPEPYEEVTE